MSAAEVIEMELRRLLRELDRGLSVANLNDMSEAMLHDVERTLQWFTNVVSTERERRRGARQRLTPLRPWNYSDPRNQPKGAKA